MLQFLSFMVAPRAALCGVQQSINRTERLAIFAKAASAKTHTTGLNPQTSRETNLLAWYQIQPQRGFLTRGAVVARILSLTYS
jgi:hypothetical protein